MRALLLNLAVLTIFFLSCQPEPSEFVRQTPGCRIKTGIYLGGGGMYDSATFSYNNESQIVKWQGQDGYYDYFYSGDKIIARIFHDIGSGQIWYVDSVYYDGSDHISSLSSYDFSQTWSPDTIHTKMVFEYLNTRLFRIYNIEFYDFGAGIISDTLYTNFIWNAAGNIDKLVYADNTGQAYDTALYQFDTNPNYFSAIHPHFFLLDPEFQLQVGLEAHMPYFYSRNNVINLNIYGTWDYPIQYGLDSTNKVTSVNMGGFEYMKYKYECN